MVAGKMDLVARKPSYGIVLDGKTGQQKKRDWWQVLLYMLFLPMVWGSGIMRIRGEVFYKTGSIDIEPEEVTDAVRAKVFALIKSVGKDCSAPPAKSPSALECGFCDISKNDCPERIAPAEETVTETELF